MRHSLTYERWYPTMFGAALAFAAWLLDFSLPDDSKKELLSATITIGGILAGFLGTAKTILLGLPREVQQRLRTSGYLDNLTLYLGEAMLGSLTVAVISVGGFFWIMTKHPVLFASAWIGVFAYSIIAFWRVSKIMLLLLRLDPNKV